MFIDSSIRLKMPRTQQTIHPESFDKGIITLPEDSWTDALKNSIFSSKIFELATCPGLMLWADMSSCGSNNVFGGYPFPEVSVHSNIFLEVVMQWGSSKHASSKWVMSLSHDMCSKDTVGFYKSTTGGYSSLILERLKDYVSYCGNPFLLPALILNEELNHIEERQRAIRAEVRRIEDAIGLRNGVQARMQPYNFNNRNVDLDFLNGQIVETSAQLLKRSPKTYLDILDALEAAMNVYGAEILSQSGHVNQSHAMLMSRLKFQQKRVQTMGRYHQVTTGRLNAQINAVSSIFQAMRDVEY
jgi:hypothetical protein